MIYRYVPLGLHANERFIIVAETVALAVAVKAITSNVFGVFSPLLPPYLYFFLPFFHAFSFSFPFLALFLRREVAPKI